jgi:N-acetyl-anhydromuramyl-L-alanine amidase AmpD
MVDETAVGSPVATSLLSGTSSLVDEFHAAGREFALPPALLAGIGFAQTRLAETDGHAHGLATAGPMGLTVTDSTADAGATTARAAALLGVPEERVRNEPSLNIRGAAALLSQAALATGVDGDQGDWTPALAAYAGEPGGQEFAAAVLRHLENGFRVTTSDGYLLVASDGVRRDRGDGSAETAANDCPSLAGTVAASGNYRPANRKKISHIVIHTAQGSFAGTVAWFRDPKARVSAHYVVNGQKVSQVVADKDVAYHDACFNDTTIGIEHEGYVEQPQRWYTEALYQRSARLTACLVKRHGIPLDRQHILGHGEAPDCSDHGDPGSGWNWNRYMQLVRQAAGASTPVQPQPGQQPQPGEQPPSRPQQPQPGQLPTAQLVAPPEQVELIAGDVAMVTVEFVNSSPDVTWHANEVRLGTAGPHERVSDFHARGQWLSPQHAATSDEDAIPPGGTARFRVALRAPLVDAPLDSVERFQLVRDGGEWFGPEVALQVRVTPRAGSDEDLGGNPAPDRTAPDTRRPGTGQDPGGSRPGSPGKVVGVDGGCAAAPGGSATGSGALALAGLLLWLARHRRRSALTRRAGSAPPAGPPR